MGMDLLKMWMCMRMEFHDGFQEDCREIECGRPRGCNPLSMSLEFEDGSGHRYDKDVGGESGVSTGVSATCCVDRWFAG